MMTILLPFMGMVVGVFLVAAKKSTDNTVRTLQKYVPQKQLLPKAIGAVILVAHASELIHVVEKASVVNVATALLLLAIWHATKHGAEDDLH